MTRHPFRSLVIGGDGAFVPFPSHSFVTYLGPHVSMLLLDCRSVVPPFFFVVLGYLLALYADPVNTSAERKKDQVCGKTEYDAVFNRVMQLPPQVQHLVVQIGEERVQTARGTDSASHSVFCLSSPACSLLSSLLLPRLTLGYVCLLSGIPIAYPRMVFLETALESKLNPLVALGRAGSMGLSGFVNKFNADAELLDDLVSLSFSVLAPARLIPSVRP